MQNRTEAVDAFIRALDHPLGEEIRSVRNIILNADERITEHIKWNAPSFCCDGEDRITFHLRARDCVQLIFHTGAGKKSRTHVDFIDDSGLLEWLAENRATVKLRDMQDIQENKAALQSLVVGWLKATA